MLSNQNIISKEHYADLFFEIRASSLKDVYFYSAIAHKISAIDNYSISNYEIKEFKFENNERELNLIEFLNELNYLIFSEGKVFEEILSFEEIILDEKFIHVFEVKFSIIDKEKTEYKRELKAVSYAQAKLEQNNGVYFFTYIIDI